MKILCTFPGKFGDLLWALPTIRAISRRVGGSVDLLLAAPLAPIVPLLQKQAYLGQVGTHAGWITQDTAPISPRIPDLSQGFAPEEKWANYDRVAHLGYRGWPLPNVAKHTWETALEEMAPDAMLEELDLQTPWISTSQIALPSAYHPYQVTVGFTDEYFELKYGVTQLILANQGITCRVVGTNPRWQREAWESGTSLEYAAKMIADSRVFLGCCSALHVLAVAVGTPAVVMEPQTMRHNPVFWPLGTTGPQVYGVTGNDGQLSFDARATRELLQRVLHR